jgi:hypothetical protein
MLRQRVMAEDNSAIGFGVPISTDKRVKDDYWQGMIVLNINGDGTVSVGLCACPSNRTFFHFAEAVAAAKTWVQENNYKFRGAITEVLMMDGKKGHEDVDQHGRKTSPRTM